MRAVFWLASVGLLGLALLGVVNAGGSLQVTCNLSGRLDEVENRELVLLFSADMLPLGGKRDPAAVVRIVPATPGEFTWRGTRTLAFRPAARWAYSTRYAVEVPAGIVALDRKAEGSRAQRWEFVTPPPLPVSAGAASDEEYEWRSVAENEELPRPFWVEEKLLLHFNQPLRADTLQRFLQVRLESDGSPLPVKLALRDPETLVIAYATRPQREARYRLTLGKGLHGSEGTAGLEKDFVFFFRTTPRFRVVPEGLPSILTPDTDSISVRFSNPLRRLDPGCVTLKVIAPGRERELAIRVDPVDSGDTWVRVSTGEEGALRAGDTVRLEVGRGAVNAWNEILDGPFQRDIPVCSRRSAAAAAEIRDGRLLARWRSMEKLSLRLYRLRDSFRKRAAGGDWGVLHEPGFGSDWLEKEVTLDWSPENDGDGGREHSLARELGGELGFFAVRVARAQPFNVCRDAALYRYPLQHDDGLHVVHLRRSDFLLRVAPGQQLFWVYDNRRGDPLAGVPLQLERGDQPVRTLGASNADGLLQAEADLRDGDWLLADDDARRDKAFFRIPDRALPVAPVVTRMQLFSERGFYKPGEIVHLAGIVREYAGGALRAPAQRAATIVVRGPDWREAARAAVTLDDRGGFAWDFPSPAAGPRGRYRFQLYFNERVEECRAIIDYYQPNTFEVTISGMADRFLRRTEFRADVGGAFLAGNPMAGDALGYRLELSPFSGAVSPRAEARDYAFGLDEKLQKRDPEHAVSARFDDGGRHTARLPLSRFAATNFVATLGFQATAKSSEGKEFTVSRNALFLPGERVCGIRLPFFNSSRQPLQAGLLLLDGTGKPVEGEVSVALFRVEYRDDQRRLVAAGHGRDVAVKERARFEMAIPGPGDYVLKVDARDPAGVVTSTSAPFWAWSADFAPEGDEFTVQAAQESCKPGDTAHVYIRSARAGKALVSIESHRIHEARVISLDKTTPFSFVVTRAHFPAVNVVVTGLFGDGQVLEARAAIQVLDEEKKLRLAIEAPDEVKPATTVKATIRVTDGSGSGRKARLFVWGVDEGNLSLSAYSTPDPFGHFWRTAGYLSHSPLRTLYSRDCTEWTLAHPDLDIPLAGAGIFGRVRRPDNSPHRPATVFLEDGKSSQLAAARVSEQGYFFFAGLRDGRYVVRAEAAGCQTLRQEVRHFGERLTEADLVLLPEGAREFPGDQYLEGVSGGVRMSEAADSAMPAPMAAQAKGMAREEEETAASGLSSIALRQNFREVLFFRQVETDGQGVAAVEFETSDQLSAYRLMAVAYDEACFGAGEKRLLVSKDLLVTENMPEFARLDDSFRAGFQVSNRLAAGLGVTAVAQAQGIALQGPGEHRLTIGGRQNGVAIFQFRADRLGEAQLRFYALSEKEKDGLLHKLAVSDNLVTETLLDFDSGRRLEKQVQPQEGAEQQRLRLRVAPSILHQTVKIAEKLIFYPYECLEQRTSRALPFLALDDALVERLELRIDGGQIRRAVQEYLDIIPEFQNEAGGLGYYRSAPWPSEYLTAYVLWAMELARDRGYRVNAETMERAANFLRSSRLAPEPEAFFQFVLSLSGKADREKVLKLGAERDKLSLTARAFLLRALHRQGIDPKLEAEIASGFLTRLQVEADFAYFDASASRYWRDLPFLSSRYVTALALSAFLDSGSDFPLAPRVVNWLLETGPEQWHTTQTNFWVLEAMGQYARAFEKKPASRAVAEIAGEKQTKVFASPRDSLQVEKDLGDRRETAGVRAEGDGLLYLTTELSYKLRNPGPKSRGITVQRNVYGPDGRPAPVYRRGQTYQVELLIEVDKEVPYGVIDEPLAAGFEVLRQDVATTRELKEYNSRNAAGYGSGWLRQENASDRVVFYSYALQGKIRVVYFIKALYSGSYTWLPTLVQGMYHPQYFGRGGTEKAEVKE